MAKPAKPEVERVDVIASAHFLHNGSQVRPGERLMLTTAEADDLISVGFVKHAPYRDRAMRSLQGR